MKKKVLYTAMLSLLSSATLYAMGLGEIKVKSNLDQPFSADIELIDVGNTPLSGIKVNLASAEDFERAGLERAYALSLLIFNVEKHANGKAFIKVNSIERITEPFMQLLVDLAWAEGQVYRSYTILLDPPNYKLSVVKHQLNNIVKRQYDANSPGVGNTITYSQVDRAPVPATARQKVVTYGPTLTNETIWQIAQHYKTSDVSLQQIILAIVGTNPQAFIEGNLNGMKQGSRLQIPATATMGRVSATLAETEVLAHDKAWQTRKPIEHALLPPYIDTIAATPAGNQQETSTNRTISESKIPSTPVFSAPIVVTPSPQFLPSMSSLLSIGEDAAPNATTNNKPAATQQARIQTNMDIVAAAIASVREVNSLLVEQLHTLQSENKRLQQQLAARDKEMKQLQDKITILLDRQGVLSQTNKQRLETETNSILPWFLLLLILSGCGFFYWSFWLRPRRARDADEAVLGGVSPLPLRPVPPTPPVVEERAAEEKPLEVDADKQQPELPVDGVGSANNNDLMHESEPVPAMPVEEMLAVPDEPTGVIEKPAELSAEEKPVDEPQSEPVVEDNEPTIENMAPLEPPISPALEEEKPELPEPQLKETPVEEDQEDDHIFEFEPGLLPAAETPVEKDKPVQEEESENTIEFVLNPVEELNSDKEEIQPVKSKAALETLLALAQTYIGMDDLEAAKQSLQEVFEFGNEKQKKEAKRLLDELDKK